MKVCSTSTSGNSTIVQWYSVVRSVLVWKVVLYLKMIGTRLCPVGTRLLKAPDFNFIVSIYHFTDYQSLYLMYLSMYLSVYGCTLLVFSTCGIASVSVPVTVV